MKQQQCVRFHFALMLSVCSSPIILFPEKKLTLLGYFSHWVWCLWDNALLLVKITVEGTLLIKCFLTCLETATCFSSWDRTIIRKVTPCIRHIYHVTAIEHVALTSKILALTIRIGLLPPRTVQGNITCTLYPSPPAKAERGPAGCMTATKIWGNWLRKRE